MMAVPTVFLNGESFVNGRMELDEILAKVDTGAAGARHGRGSLSQVPPSTC
jgi:alkyl hydroperoxide reductase subunit F